MRRGWSYPVGRDAVEAALREADAEVGWLSFTMPEPKHRPLGLITILTFGTGGSRYFAPDRGRGPGIDSVFRLDAVPAALARTAGGLLRDSVLARASAWLAASNSTGDVRTASAHSWRASLVDGTATVIEERGRS